MHHIVRFSIDLLRVICIRIAIQQIYDSCISTTVIHRSIEVNLNTSLSRLYIYRSLALYIHVYVHVCSRQTKLWGTDTPTLLNVVKTRLRAKWVD